MKIDTTIDVYLTSDELNSLCETKEVCQKIGLKARKAEENNVIVNGRSMNHNLFYCAYHDLQGAVDALLSSERESE